MIRGGRGTFNAANEAPYAAENLPCVDHTVDDSRETPRTMTDSKRDTSQADSNANALLSQGVPKGALGFLWEGGRSTHAFYGGGLVALVLTVLPYFLPAAPPGWMWALLVTGVIAFSLIFSLAHALYSSTQSAHAWFAAAQRVTQDLEKLERENGAMTVEAAEKPFHPYDKAKCVLIVRWPKMPFPQGSRVTIAIAQETHERPLGSGTIRPRQFDQKEVVTLDDTYPNVDNLVNAVLQPNSDMVKRLRIGPAIDLQNVPSAPSPTPDAGETEAMAERQEQ